MAIFNINIERQGLSQEDIIYYVYQDSNSGSILYLAEDGLYHKATASIKEKSTTELVMLLKDATVNSPIEFISVGEYTFDSPTLVEGKKYYLSVFPGEITTSQYTNTNNVIRYIGTALNNVTLIFNPDQTYISDNGTKVNDVEIKTPLQQHTHIEADISDLDKYSVSEVDEFIAGLKKDYSIIPTDIKMNGVQSLGVLNTLPRADHIHPVDTSREPNLGNPVANGYILSSSILGVRTWIPAGGGIPTLQQVTTAGNTSTNIITLNDGLGASVNLYPSGTINCISPGSSYFMYMEAPTCQIGGYNGTNFKTILQFPVASAQHIINIPNKAGTFALLDDIVGGNSYTHPAYTTRSITATGASVLSTFTSDAIGSVTGITTRTLTPANIGAEVSLGNPSVSGYVLSSTTGGVRSWIAPATGGSYTHPTYTARNIGTSGAQVLSTFTSDAIGSVTNITTRNITTTDINAEVYLGNPSITGYVLSSTTNGVRSWVAQAAGANTNLGRILSATTVIITSDTGADATIEGASSSLSGILTASTQTIGGSKTFVNSVTAPDFIGNSDKTLKENIKDLSSTKLNTNYKTFNFINNKQSRTGLIAQEVEIENPEFVRTDEDGIKSISYIDLHSAEIAYLKDKVERLEKLINKLVG